ncbi:MAG: sensor histidine kinase [Acidimicrobiia bacterium]
MKPELAIPGSVRVANKPSNSGGGPAGPAAPGSSRAQDETTPQRAREAASSDASRMPVTDPMRAFLFRTVRIGVRTTLMVLIGLALFPFIPGNRIEDFPMYLAILAMAAGGVALVHFVQWDRYIGSSFGNWILYLWSVVDIALITLAIGVTGGGRSELYVLYVLTTIFFAVSYPKGSKIPLTGLTLVSYLLVLFITGAEITAAVLFVRVGLLVSLALLCSFLASELIRLLSAEHRIASQLTEADEMKNSFLAAVSHELRTPLTVVLGFSETLARPDVRISEDQRRDFASKIAINARKLTGILDDLLDVERLSEPSEEARMRYTDLADVVSFAIEDSELESTHQVSVELKPVIVPIDEKKVFRIVSNLLSNVAKHTPPGTQAWVRVSGDPEGAVISVEDAGPGVPEDLSDALFELFRQGPDIPMHSPGLGKGLFLVAKFAAMHGGRAWSEPRSGGGAVFKVFLPGITHE